MDRKCEVFGCLNLGSRSCQIAPGTNVWICVQCHQEFIEEGMVKEKPHPSYYDPQRRNE